MDHLGTTSFIVHGPFDRYISETYRQYSLHLLSTSFTIDSSITRGEGYPAFQVASIPTIPRYTGRAPTNVCSVKNISRAGSNLVKIPHCKFSSSSSETSGLTPTTTRAPNGARTRYPSTS